MILLVLQLVGGRIGIVRQDSVSPKSLFTSSFCITSWNLGRETGATVEQRTRPSGYSCEKMGHAKGRGGLEPSPNIVLKDSIVFVIINIACAPGKETLKMQKSIQMYTN